MNFKPGDDREKDNLQNFKKVVRDMLKLLRTSLQVETVSMHWVNPHRDIFVLAGYSTMRKDVVYQDRVRRENHFLKNYNSIKSITRLEKNIHFKPRELEHYTSSPPINYIYLIPFVFNAETVAITTVESATKPELKVWDEQMVAAYQKVLTRMLQSYQEISELVEKQSEWVEYDHTIRDLTKAEDPLELAMMLVEKLQLFMGDGGGVVMLARGLDEWHSVLYSAGAKYPPPIGLAMEKGSIAAKALSDGEPFYSPHFNASPKRISTLEPLCNGASLAIPVMHRQRRQLLILAYSENPLLFSEAVKHKISNLCRVAGLKLEAMLPDLDVYENIFATGVSSYSRTLVSGILTQLTRHIRLQDPTMPTWIGMLTIGNINDLRTRYRLEELTSMQQQVMAKLRPQNFGIPGIIGAYSDYVYTFLLQSTDESALLAWTGSVKEAFRNPLPISEKDEIVLRINTGVVRLNGEMDTKTDTIIQNIKKAMNDAVKQQKFIVEV